MHLRRGHPRPRPPGAALLGLATTAATLLVLVGPAWAHVDAEATGVGDGGATSVVLTFHHGCDGQPTTALAVAVPEGASDVVAQDPPGWTSEVGSDEIVWRGGSVDDGVEATFTFSARLAQADGDTVVLPTVQTCPDGEQAWIGPPETGEDDEASDPAPSFVVPPGGGQQAQDVDGPGDADEPTTTASTRVDGTTLPPGQVTASQADDDEGTGPNAGGTTGLAVFALVVVVLLGGAVLLYVRNRGKGNVTPRS